MVGGVKGERGFFFFVFLFWSSQGLLFLTVY